jgi:hypothetical protein
VKLLVCFKQIYSGFVISDSNAKFYYMDSKRVVDCIICAVHIVTSQILVPLFQIVGIF